MTLAERFKNIGLALRGELPVKEVIKDVATSRHKDVYGGFIDLFKKNLSSEIRISSKLLEANTGWVYRNTDVIAREVANTEFELYTIKFVGGEIQFDPIRQHSLLDLLDRFNEFTTKSDGLYITSSHQTLAGDSFWLLDGSGPNIKSIYILQPDKVELILGDQKGGQRIIEGYKFRDTVNGKPVNVDYDAEQIIHFKSPNPKNPYRGLSKVEVAAESIDTDNLAINAAKMLFERGMITNFLLSSDQRFTPEQRKQLQADFRAAYTGSQNAYKVPILAGGLKPESVQMTNREMQFIDIQEWLRDKITSIFGNNKAILGVTDDVNRANADATILNWKRTTVTSEIRSIVDTLNEFLVPNYGENIILGFKEVVEEDESYDIDNVKALIEANIITPNEARQRLGMDPIKDETADSRRTSSTELIPEIPKSLRNVNYTKMLRKYGMFNKTEAYHAIKQASKPIAAKILKFHKKPKQKFISYSDEQALDYYYRQLNIIHANEKIFQDKVENYINRLIDKAVSNVPSEVAEMQQKQLFDEDDEIDKAKAEFVPILVAVAVAARHHALDLINFDKPLIDTSIQQKVAERVEWFAKSMLQTDKDKLIDIIAQGVAEGESIPSIRNTITETFLTYSKSQAEKIARTEVAYTSVQSTLDTWKESGVVEGKEWIVVSPEDDCLDYAGKVVPLDEEFPEGDPPLHPNCKCSVLPVLLNEKGKAQFFKQKAYESRIEELEAKIDKRTKEFRDLKAEKLEVEKYVKRLEEYVNG